MSIATQVSESGLAANFQVQNGETITVYGITVANKHTSNMSIEFQTGTGNVEFTIVVPAETSHTMDIPFLADGGLTVDAPASNGALVLVTVFHSAGGA